MNYLAMLWHKNHFPGGREIYNFGRPFLGLLYYILSLSGLCPGVEVKIIFSLYDISGHSLA